jgi:hypothetical protein
MYIRLIRYTPLSVEAEKKVEIGSGKEQEEFKIPSRLKCCVKETRHGLLYFNHLIITCYIMACYKQYHCPECETAEGMLTNYGLRPQTLQVPVLLELLKVGGANNGTGN